MYRHKRPAFSYPVIKSRRYKDAVFILSRSRAISEVTQSSYSIMVVSALLEERDAERRKDSESTKVNEVGLAKSLWRFRKS